jgi:class 3 adenylate cyclase
VNIAARVEAHAAADEILVSRTARDMLLGSTETFRDAGEHELKGIEGLWRLYAAV